MVEIHRYILLEQIRQEDSKEDSKYTHSLQISSINKIFLKLS